jgi:hypothetical protein
MNHVNRIYTLMLIVLLVFTVLTCGEMIMLRPRFAQVPRGLAVLKFVEVTYAIYVAAIVATLILRATKPRLGRIATAALNIALLTAFPLGTVVAVFGLLKVDKAE